MADSPIGHANLGAILERSDPQEAAQASSHTALQLDPENVAAYIDLGNILARSGKLDAAIIVLSQRTGLEPDFVEVRHNLPWPWRSGNNAACRPEASTAVEPRPEARSEQAVDFSNAGQTAPRGGVLREALWTLAAELADCGGCSR